MIDIEAVRVEQCPICSSSNFRLLGLRDEILSNRINRYSFTYNDVICLDCSFVYSCNRQDEQKITHYYANYHNSSAETQIDENNLRWQTLARFANHESKILEIGGGQAGTFTKYLAQKGYSVINIEVGDPWPNPASVDIAICYYLLEHINDLSAFMDIIYKVLKDGGIFIFEVPDFSKFPGASLNEEHVNHFHENVLPKLAETFRFKNISSANYGPGRYFGMVAVFEKGQGGIVNAPKLIDFDVRQSIVRDLETKYFKVSAAREKVVNEIQTSLATHISLKEKILIWGCNQNYIRLREHIDNIHENYITLVDSSQEKQKQTIYQDPIIDPEKIDLEEYSLFIICASSAFDVISDFITSRVNDPNPEILCANFAIM